jgi:hypothetical protein
MCIALIKKAGSPLPTKEILERCFKVNPDGGGWVVPRKDGLEISKGYFNFIQFYEELVKAVPVEVPALIHMRIATHGFVDAGNCHPFPYTNSYTEMRNDEQDGVDVAMIHNGILSMEPENLEVSDTMTFTKSLFVAGIDPFAESAGFLLEKIIDTSKVAFMNRSGDVVKFGTWVEENGVYFSNSGYKPAHSHMVSDNPLFKGHTGKSIYYEMDLSAFIEPQELANLSAGLCPYCTQALSEYSGSCWKCQLNFQQAFYEMQEWDEDACTLAGIKASWEDSDGLVVFSVIDNDAKETPKAHKRLPSKEKVDNVNQEKEIIEHGNS